MKHTHISRWPLFAALGCSCLLNARAATAAVTVLTNDKTITDAVEMHYIQSPPGPIQVTQDLTPAAVALPDGGFEVNVNGAGSYSHGGGLQQSEHWHQVKFTFAFELDGPAEYSYRAGAAAFFIPPGARFSFSPPEVRLEGGPPLPSPDLVAGVETAGVLPAGRYTLTGLAGVLPPYTQPPQPTPVPVGYWVFNDFTFRVAPEPAALGTMVAGAALLMRRRGRR